MDYYAVFDGHGGQDAAAYCATHLHQYLVESMHYPTDPENALRDAFLTTDAQFIAKSSTQVNVSYMKFYNFYNLFCIIRFLPPITIDSLLCFVTEIKRWYHRGLCIADK